jgi:anti-sigma28 factor (negative regulator of flagellin synthesis)
MEVESLNADIKGRELIGHTQPIGEGNRDMRISEIQEQVGRGEYRVDTHAVADAILRRLLLRAEVGGPGKPPQGECS